MPFVTDRLAEEKQKEQPDQEYCVASHVQPATPSDDDFARASTGRIDAARIANHLRKTVFGQDDAIDAIFRTMSIAQGGLSDPFRPIASHLFVGPTGTGKTEIVRQVAAALRTGPEDFCQVDMSSMAQEHYAASFSGAPPGYAGSKESFSVFDRSRIEGNSSMPGIVLFDEVEKAHRTVLLALLHILDRGTLKLANGEKRINFRNCIVFMTSNLGSREIRTAQTSPLRRLTRLIADRSTSLLQSHTEHKIAAITQDALTDFFDPEFINRIDETTIFHEITPAVARDIARRELDLVVAQAFRRGIEVTYTDEVVEFLVREGFDPVYGARSVRRTIQRTIAPPLAHHVINQRVDKLAGAQGQATVLLDHTPAGIVTTADRPAAPAPDSPASG